jgi:hypothetical protein
MLRIYLAGMLAMFGLLMWNGIVNGGLQRYHDAGQWLVLVAVSVTVSACWPVLLTVGLLAYFGIVPGPVWFPF